MILEPLFIASFKEALTDTPSEPGVFKGIFGLVRAITSYYGLLGAVQAYFDGVLLKAPQWEPAVQPPRVPTYPSAWPYPGFQHLPPALRRAQSCSRLASSELQAI